MSHSSGGRLRAARCTALLAALAPQACVPDAVRWGSEERSATAPAAQGRLALSAEGVARFVEAWVPPAMPEARAMCAGSLMTVRARGDTAFAAWWAPRPDSSALLVVARSDDGGRRWRAPEVADSTDRGHSGCARTAPFVAADSVNGYVHVVYFMVAAEGPGVFFTHSMAGGAAFHAPVPIVYGERAGEAAVASHGDTVAVAYQDPNASAPQIWLALSHSTGHIFEQRTSVSSANATAARPAVAVSEGRVAVAWRETARDGGATTVVVRTGTVHW